MSGWVYRSDKGSRGQDSHIASNTLHSPPPFCLCLYWQQRAKVTRPSASTVHQHQHQADSSSAAHVHDDGEPMYKRAHSTAADAAAQQEQY